MKPVQAVAVIGVTALSLSACSGSAGPSSAEGGAYQDGKTFTMVLEADPGNLDPHFTSQSSTWQVDRFLYDSLVNIDEHGKIVPGLAKTWHATTTRATFTLRKGITCSDGSRLTARDVAANINFVAEPKNASTRLGVFVPPGAKAVGNDTAGTVTVTSATPDSFLDRNLGGLHIVCPKGMKNRTLIKQKAAGTGMFELTEAVPGDHYTLTRRKDYAWGPGNWKTVQKGLPDKVVLRVISNESTAANLLLAREVNLVTLIGPDRQRLRGLKLVEREVVSPLGELWFNQADGLPGADEKVRRALTQALDLDALAKALTSGSGKPATGLVAPGMGPCSKDTVRGNLPSHDLDAAKSALDTAGWRTGPGGARTKGGKKLMLTFYYSTSTGATQQAATAELVQKQWKSLGVRVTLKGATDAESGKLVVGGEGAWDVAILPLGVALPTEAVSFLSGPRPPKGHNFAAIDNKPYTAAVGEASGIAGTGGCQTWAKAEKHIFRHVDLVPFVNAVTPKLAQGATFELSQGAVTPGSIRMTG
ncbi:peptide ABC transporter substrate-binding protein [Streptomyces sp. PRh5]|uniref:ABC transporter substrate-binding protein n=1 Tax=Streptomyces sp. PRh5 TaxID=1158056 RepID=UPI00044BDB8C|nr:ABC transporter substrate-binding protein [Streptomyces sp. PRh5]EXU63670.1 peptide ABC transporter substrate-binding protein [Streptomyces sp. PRh5]